ncbi:MAG: transglutaminase family protein, partial [Shimia sp.]
MSIRVALTHRTTYAYDRKIQLGPQVIRLRPAPHTRTPVASYSLKIEPKGHFLNWMQDPFGNWEARVVFPERTDRFAVTVDVVADMVAINPFDFFLEDSAFHVPFDYREALRSDLAPYLETTESGARFEALVKEIEALWSAEDEERETIDFLVTLNQRIRDLVGYVVRMEPGVQSPEETLEAAKGSCRDSAWLLVHVLRRLGIAARFVSGYLIQLTPDEREEGDGPEADFTDLHAWAEAYLPGAGWVGLDATSGLFAGEGHIPLAATPAPSSAAPISGGLEKAEVSFDFDMAVTRLREPARNTQPLTEGQWRQVDAAGEAIDAILTENDVRLTQGGEPTFVSATDRDADEWTIGAVGPTKRAHADDLIRRFRERFAAGGLLMHGQGKWYPGEPLPRWAFTLTWRADGEPLWTDLSLIATEDGAAGDAPAFAKDLAESLGLASDFAQPVYEDPAPHLLDEANLPENLSPADNKLDNPTDRARMARVFDQGLGTPVGMVLPLQQQQDMHNDRVVRWQSEIWRTRRKRLFAVPGDSPLGFRLPIKALPHIDKVAYPHVYDPDPSLAVGDLPPARILQQVHGRAREARPAPAPVPEATEAVRTALAIEKKDGTLNVFLPPVATADAFCDLIAAIEGVAKRQNTPVRIEGYP